MISIECCGASVRGKVCLGKFDYRVDKVVAKVKVLLR
jgi:hypothetical protein